MSSVTPETPETPVALFDVDGVLATPYVLTHFARYLAQHDMFDAEQLRVFAEASARPLSYDAFSQLGARLYARGLAGRSAVAIAEQAVTFWQTHTHLILPYAHQLTSTLRPYCTLIMISGASRESLIPLAEMLGISHIFATELTAQDGVFTGEEPVSGALQHAKQAAVDRISLTAHARRASFAFADHPYHDRPLLEAVGNPYLLTDEIAKCAENTRWRCYPQPVNAEKLLAHVKQHLPASARKTD